jgi:hypothetical protein
MHDELALVGELEPSDHMAPYAANALRYGIELAVLARKERHDPIGFSELTSAQDNASRLIGARLRQNPPIPPSG